MDNQKIILEQLASISDVNLDENLSIQEIEVFEKEIELANQKYMKDFKIQMQKHQLAIDKMNTLTTQFIDVAMSTLSVSDNK